MSNTVALSRRQEFSSSLLDACPDAIYLMDRDGIILQANTVCARQHHMTVDQLIGKCIFDLLPANIARLRRSGWAELENSQAPTLHLEFQTGQWIEARQVPVFDDDGELSAAAVYAQNVTWRIEAEQTLRDNAASLRHAQEIAGLGVFERDLTTGLAHWTEHVFTMLGISPDTEPSVQLFIEFVIPEDRDEFVANIRRAESDMRPRQHDYRIRHADGSIRHHYAMIEILTDAEGNPIKYVGVIQDITARKQVEDALTASETRLRHAQSIARLGMFEREIPTNALYWSAEARAIFGVPDDLPLTYETFLNIVHPDDVERVQKNIEHMIETGKPFDDKFRIQRADGSIRHIHRIGETVTDLDGTPIRTLGTVQDVSEQKETEQRLRESEETFRGLFENAAVGISLRNFDRSLRRHNQAFCDMLGYSAEELQSIPVSDLAHPADDPKTTSLRHIGFAEDDTQNLERCFITKDGRTICTDVTYKLIRDANGRPTSTIAIYQDVTERKEAEERLHQSQKMESLGQLTGGVAHEFNNLLMAITGNLEMMQDLLPSGDEASSLAQNARRAAHRGAELTGDLLSYVGKQMVTERTVNLGAEISDIVALLKPTLGETIRIQTQLAPDIWDVRIDPSQLRDAMVNLALNARDAMPGGGDITIETANTHLDQGFVDQQALEIAAGEYVRIKVQDNGAGMSPEILAQAFDPFFTTKDVGDGTGLGLSMVYGFVTRQSGGYIDIETELDRGTTISIYLPRVLIGHGLTPADDRLPETVKSGTGTIMVIEDNTLVSDGIGRYLRDCGYHVLVAENGVSAISMFESSVSVDIVLCDVVLPDGMTGPDVISKLQQRQPGLRVIYMTGYADEQAFAQGVPEGSGKLLHKPFSLRHLANIIAEELENSPSV